MKKISFVFACILLSCAALGSCGGAKSYKDGTYTAQSSIYDEADEESEDDGGNGYGVVTITIKDNKIVDCEFLTFEPDGTPKDNEDYGKKNGEIANNAYYVKAQKAVAANAVYAEALVSSGSLDGVDAVSGATISYGEFREAVQLALKQAEE